MKLVKNLYLPYSMVLFPFSSDVERPLIFISHDTKCRAVSLQQLSYFS